VKLLLDTHTILWWFLDDPSLSQTARRAIGSARHDAWISTISIFEIETKARLGKLEIPPALEANWAPVVHEEGWSLLPINHHHARLSARLTAPHRDPFDRLIAGQAIAEDLTVVTRDSKIADLGAKTLW